MHPFDYLYLSHTAPTGRRASGRPLSRATSLGTYCTSCMRSCTTRLNPIRASTEKKVRCLVTREDDMRDVEHINSRVASRK